MSAEIYVLKISYSFPIIMTIVLAVIDALVRVCSSFTSRVMVHGRPFACSRQAIKGAISNTGGTSSTFGVVRDGYVDTFDLTLHAEDKP